MQAEFESSELELFRDNVRRFLEEEIEPHYAQWGREEIIPREIWRKMGEAGLLCVDTPEQYGGFSAHFRFSAVVLEEFARAGCIGLAGGIAIHSDIVASYILNFGSEEQKQNYLPKMVCGESVGALAMTEPGTGSDLQGIRTNAKMNDGGYIINGSKTFITNGQHCDFVVLVTRTDAAVSGSGGTTLFIVDCSLPGFSRGRNLEKIGMHESDTSELFFEDLQVPKAAILGELNSGFAVMMEELPRERLAISITAVGAAEGALGWTIEYVQERKAFGKPLSQFQNTRFSIAKMQTQIRSNRAFLNECIDLFTNKALDTATASMIKLSSTETQCQVMDDCLQLFGGYGYMMEYPIGRAFIDSRVQRIYGGTSEIMKEIIARSLLGR